MWGVCLCVTVLHLQALRDAGTEIIADTENYPRVTGGVAKNRAKNRYRDILPCKLVYSSSVCGKLLCESRTASTNSCFPCPTVFFVFYSRLFQSEAQTASGYRAFRLYKCQLCQSEYQMWEIQNYVQVCMSHRCHNDSTSIFSQSRFSTLCMKVFRGKVSGLRWSSGLHNFFIRINWVYTVKQMEVILIMSSLIN